jgi:hypothetical protein
MKKPRLVLAALILLMGAASAVGSKLPVGADYRGESVMQTLKHKNGS